MRRLRKLKLTAEKLIGSPIKAEITSNHNYFMRRTSEIFPFNLFFFAPASNYKHRIVYIPRIWLLFKKFSLGLAVHELLHIKYPSLSEDETVFMTKRLMHGQNN